MFDVPILVIAYNRVEFTHDLFTEIRKMHPTKLYVAADAAPSEERIMARQCLKVRSVFMPEWPCELNEMHLEKHLGKSQIFLQAMNWFFERETEGIVLFDDTLPSASFFHYCKEMLDHFRDDRRIGHISGCNILKYRDLPTSYYFSAYPCPWGFATWRDRWQGFDLKMRGITESTLPELTKEHYILKNKTVQFWIRRYRLLSQQQIDIWEYQYIFHLWQMGMLSVNPDMNLVENRGFVNKKKRRLRKLNRPIGKLDHIVHNEVVEQDAKADRFIFRRYFRMDRMTFLRRWIEENILND
ncbi:MAG: hypothetical protein J5642_02295 [Bacteroidales bacterium]|nr:hypothetical protein [Bacteroidales bacterium]